MSEKPPDMYISDAKTARMNIGRRVYWDDRGQRYVFLRQGKLEAVTGREIVIDGDYKTLRYLKGLRNFEKGGDFAEKVAA
jgi:hypothetical protein